MTVTDFSLMFETFVDAVVVADSTHRIVYVNPAGERLLDWPAGDLVGQPLTTIIPPRLQAEHREGFKRFLATHKPRVIGRPLRVPALRRDGREVQIELSLNALRTEGDDLIVASLRDLGGQVELERQLTVLRYLRATTRAAARFGSLLDAQQVLETVVGTLVADFDATLARIWLYDPASRQLLLRASAGLSTATATSARARIDLDTHPFKIGEVARTGQPYTKNHLEGDPQFDQAWVARERIVAAAVFPLQSGSELRGVLAYFSRRLLPDEVVEALTAFVAIVTTSLADLELFTREQAARVEAEVQRQKLQAVLDVLPMGVLLAEGHEGRVTLINPAGQEIFGAVPTPCSMAELHERVPVAAMDGQPFTPTDRPLGRALYRGERLRDAVRYRRADGQDRVLEVMAGPIPGPIGGAVATFRDITSRLRMESELADRASQLKALLDHLPVGVAYFDDQGVCRASNGPARRILGRSRSEITGVPARELFQDAPGLLQAVERCVREPSPHAETSSPWPDPADPASVRFLDWRFEPLPAPSGAPYAAGALALIVDVTDRKQAEDQLKVAKEAAEQSALKKTRFLSAVSHDLRTPVNALSLLAELLAHLVGQGGPIGDEVIGLAEDIRLATANLIELINDLLDLARFDAGDIAQHPSDFLLEEWLAASLEPLQLTARTKGLELSWQVDRPGRVVHADRVKLSRVLTNLVGNAIKFTESGAVAVTAGATPEGWLELAVRDTGPGIPEDQLERIFDEFAQLRNPERDRTKGTGLGLAICKRLVEAAGGRLTVVSRPGAGSTFTATYPPGHLKDSPPPPSGTASGTSARVKPRAPIVLVEDDPRSRQALARLLERIGCSVATAADGPSALSLLQNVQPALILLDLMLPGMDGMELLRRMRTEPGRGSVPVVLLSGDVLNARHETLAQLGVVDVLAKPVDFDALVRVIARHVQVEPAPG